MQFAEELEMEHISKGTKIEHYGDGTKKIFFVKKGSVKIVNSSNGVVKYIVRRGNLFGELALYHKEAANKEIAFTLEDSIICYLESERMEKLIGKNKSLKNGILKAYSVRIIKLERRLEDLLYKDSTTRIKAILLQTI